MGGVVAGEGECVEGLGGGSGLGVGRGLLGHFLGF